jgi:hypothetical protein
MDSPWTYALIALALIAGAFSYGVPRAWRWIGLGGVSFFVTTAFLDYGDRPDLHPFLTLACDALVCLFIFRGFREEWEIGVFIAFLCSCFASLLRIGGFVPAPWVYASLLELCNAGALLWITGIGLIDLIGRNENSPVHHWRRHLRHARVDVGSHGKASRR